MHSQVDKAQWGGEKRFDALLDNIRQRREEFEAQRHLSPDIVEEFQAIGVYRAMVPARYGGDEKSPAEFLKMVEAISAADGSAGWVASFGMNPAYLAALPEATITQIWNDSPDVVFAGASFRPIPPSGSTAAFASRGAGNSPAAA